MTTTYTLRIDQGIGYSGKHGSRAYVARIVGTSDRFDLDREFIDADKVERDHFGRAKYTRTYIHHLPAGLYEVSEGGSRRYLIVWLRRDGKIGATNPDAARAMAIAALLEAGETFEAARLATKPAPLAPVVASAEAC